MFTATIGDMASFTTGVTEVTLSAPVPAARVMIPPATAFVADASAFVPTAKDRLIVALDFSAAETALQFVERLDGSCRWFKVGMELFYSAGSHIVHALRDCGFEVFLDLKLHDIPNTVAGAVKSVAATGASLLTVHAAGGSRMMQAAVEAAQLPGAPRLIAVTVLTSLDASDLNEIGVASSNSEEQTLRLATLAQRSGIDGMVCSPLEVSSLRKQLRPGALLVVPGIRPAGALASDQRRVATPASAIKDGASMLVVGRPITAATDPAAAASAILEEMQSAVPGASGRP